MTGVLSNKWSFGNLLVGELLAGIFSLSFPFSLLVCKVVIDFAGKQAVLAIINNN
jgi:hypothetical protein